MKGNFKKLSLTVLLALSSVSAFAAGKYIYTYGIGRTSSDHPEDALDRAKREALELCQRTATGCEIYDIDGPAQSGGYWYAYAYARGWMEY